MSSESDADLFQGLRALLESTFPKKCPTCGRIYADAEAFFRETQAAGLGRRSLKYAIDDDGSRIVEAFRNCVCGSTLMDAFGDRRDNSPAGDLRRRRMAEMLERLVERGVDRAIARVELLKAMHGEKSELLAKLRSQS